IVAKALEKDKTRRYQSAADLAADIQRHLRDEPIVARPATAIYQLRKFTRRNRPLMAGLAAALLLLALGVAATTWQAVRATTGWRQAASAGDQAREESAKARAVKLFLQRILVSVSPESARGRDVSVLREMLDAAADRAERVLADQPLVRADVQFTI